MLPAGTIVLWFGSIGSIPAGWIICDGGGGSPDLKNKFVVGAGDTYAVDDTGGAANHNHPFTGDGHNHTFPAGSDIAAGAGKLATTTTSLPTGTTDASSSLPPFHALAYIMKT